MTIRLDEDRPTEFTNSIYRSINRRVTLFRLVNLVATDFVPARIGPMRGPFQNMPAIYNEYFILDPLFLRDNHADWLDCWVCLCSYALRADQSPKLL